MQNEIHQEMRDWLRHPITSNFTKGVNEAIDFYKESLSTLDTDFDSREVARKIGVIQGLESLLTYDPEINDKGEIIDES